MSDLFTMILEHAARQSGFKPGVHLFREVWPALVGPEVARHSRPCAWRDATLTVEADADWRPALERQSRRVLRRLTDRLPWAIEAVVFVDAPATVVPAAPGRGASSTQRRRQAGVEPEQAEALDALPADLREHLLRIRGYMNAERAASTPSDADAAGGGEKDDENG